MVFTCRWPTSRAEFFARFWPVRRLCSIPPAVLLFMLHAAPLLCCVAVRRVRRIKPDGISTVRESASASSACVFRHATQQRRRPQTRTNHTGDCHTMLHVAAAFHQRRAHETLERLVGLSRWLAAREAARPTTRDGAPPRCRRCGPCVRARARAPFSCARLWRATRRGPTRSGGVPRKDAASRSVRAPRPHSCPGGGGGGERTAGE